MSQANDLTIMIRVAVGAFVAVIVCGLIASAIIFRHAYSLDSPQMDKSHCAPGVQGRCIEIKPNPCGDRK